MKAWYITLKDDPTGSEFSDVVHAPTRGKAIMKSRAIDYYGFDFLDCRAVRLPEMDDRPVTDKNLYTYGKFDVYCNGEDCERNASDENEPYFDEKGRAFCGTCWKIKQVVNQ